jgi:glycosyltransferase involved in cell wall biosynthesis
MRRHWARRTPRPVAALADAVDMRSFAAPDPARTAALRERLGVPLGRQVVGYLGLLAEYQGVGQLIYAARQIVERRPQTHFLIMGYPGLERYVKQAHDLQLLDHVTFTGRVPYAALAEHLALVDVAVSAKLSATEGNGKLLNYMALGLPCVAYDTPVARELLGPLGVYAPAGDVTALGHAIEGLLDNPGRRASLAPRLKERAASEFSWDAAGKRLASLYEDVVAQRHVVRLNPDARRV